MFTCLLYHLLMFTCFQYYLSMFTCLLYYLPMFTCLLYHLLMFTCLLYPSLVVGHARRQHFPGKFLLSGKFFLRGPWNGRGPKFWNTPPNQKPVGTALYKSCSNVANFTSWMRLVRVVKKVKF